MRVLRSKAFTAFIVLAFLGAISGFAQEQPSNPDANTPFPPEGQQVPVAPDPAEAPPPSQMPSRAPDRGWRHFSDNRPPDAAPYQVPSELRLPSGSWLSVRINQMLSTNRNHPGDAFMATLVQPLVVNGIVIARPGQTVAGRVSVSEKAGRVSGTSRLGVEIVELSLVDGQQVPVHSVLVSRDGGTSIGRDLNAIGTTTGVGAAIGAAAGGGLGAGLGAAAGLGASIIGVLVTRGRPSVIYPETVLTFRIDAPVIVSTVHAPEAFQPVEQGDYSAGLRRQLGRRPPPPPYYSAPYPYPYPYPYFRTGIYFGRGWGYRRW